MSSCLVALPILAWVGLWALFAGEGARRGKADWRDAFLSASLAWGTIAALSAEALSPFHFITRLGVGLTWAAVIGACLLAGVRSGRLRLAWDSLRSLRPSLTPSERWILFGTAMVVLLLLLIAWVSPPNNYDSYLYHMARVVHWAQAGSLDHFPSGFEHQLTKPTWAETAILHLRVLWGDDRPANLVQWFSMLGSMVGVSAIAGLLGGSRRAQFLAITIALSIPMGILQATSTQNDYVVAFWMVCLAYLVVRRGRGPSTPGDAMYVGLAAGLGLLTKGTGYVYAVPLLAWYFWPRRPWLRLLWLRDVGIVAALVVLLNLGFWWRNVVTFGGPFGTSEWLSANLTLGPVLISKPEQPAAIAPAIEVEPTGQAFLQGLIEKALSIPKGVAQITAFQLVTPFGRIQRPVVGLLETFPAIFDTTWMERIRLSWNHEDLAPSPVHMVLGIMALVGVWFLRPRASWGALRAYGAMIGAAYLLLPAVIGHGASLWGIRYVLPFFVLSAPLVALVQVAATRERWTLAVAGGLIVLAVPWTLLNSVRPLISSTQRLTRVESILTADRTEVMLANIQWEQEGYTAAAAEVLSLGCRTVGLIGMQDSYPEYPLWWILQAPQSGLRIESLTYSVYTDRYVDPSFKPCVIICAGCDAGRSMPGYDLVNVYGSFSAWRRE